MTRSTKLLGLLLAVVLLASLLPSALAASKPVPVVYINSAAIAVARDTIPVVQDKAAYGSAALLSSLGTLHCNSKESDNMLSLTDAVGNWMVFALDDGYVYTTDNRNLSKCKLVKQEGTYYLPLAEICKFFGYYYELYTGSFGAAVLIDTTTTEPASTELAALKQRAVAEVPVLVRAYQDGATAPSANPTAPPSGTPTTSRVTLPPVIPSAGSYTSRPTPTASQPTDGSGTTEVSPTPKPMTTKVIYLTIDDGPSQYTHAILDVLDQHGAKATFFMQGCYYEDGDDALRRIVGSGHAYGLHSYTHSESKFYASPEAMIGELNQCNDLMRAIAVTRSRLVRTPYGSDPYFSPGAKKHRPGQREAMNNAGFRYWDWDIDSNDWRFKKDQGAEVGQGIINQLKNHDFSSPAIVLFHEKSFTAGFLPAVLAYGKSIGAEFRAITDVDSPYNYQRDRT